MRLTSVSLSASPREHNIWRSSSSGSELERDEDEDEDDVDGEFDGNVCDWFGSGWRILARSAKAESTSESEAENHIVVT